VTYGHNGETHQDGIGHETPAWFPIISWTKLANDLYKVYI